MITIYNFYSAAKIYKECVDNMYDTCPADTYAGFSAVTRQLNQNVDICGNQ